MVKAAGGVKSALLPPPAAPLCTGSLVPGSPSAAVRMRLRSRRCQGHLSPGWGREGIGFLQLLLLTGFESAVSGCGAGRAAQGGGAGHRRQLGPAESGGQGAPGKGTVCVSAGRVRALCQGPGLAPCSAPRLAAGFELP